MNVEEAGLALLTPDTYTDDHLVLSVVDLLRTEAPVVRIEHPDHRPVTVLTRYADIREIELKSRELVQGKDPFLATLSQKRREKQSGRPQARMLIHMDGEEHRHYRGLTASWFTPRNLARLEDRLARLATRYVDEMAARGTSCDFAADVAANYPLHVILSILGLPEEDFPLMLEFGNRLLGMQDPEYVPDPDAVDAFAPFFEYFSAVTADRRQHPTDDLATLIANGRLPNDDALPLGETIGYYTIFAVAGHDTTASAIAGGLRALIEDPEQLERLRSDPSLIKAAADEIIRWVTPVKHFTRTAAVPYRLRDHALAVGEQVFLSYPGANFDPAVFDAPHDFDVARTPNDHLAFGYGAHFCLGAQLARMEIRAVLAELVPRLRSVELGGPPKMRRSISVGGLTRLPVRYLLD